MDKVFVIQHLAGERYSWAEKMTDYKIELFIQVNILLINCLPEYVHAGIILSLTGTHTQTTAFE